VTWHDRLEAVDYLLEQRLISFLYFYVLKLHRHFHDKKYLGVGPLIFCIFFNSLPFFTVSYANEPRVVIAMRKSSLLFVTVVVCCAQLNLDVERNTNTPPTVD
jgi:hypothetical protein